MKSAELPVLSHRSSQSGVQDERSRIKDGVQDYQSRRGGQGVNFQSYTLPIK